MVALWKYAILVGPDLPVLQLDGRIGLTFLLVFTTVVVDYLGFRIWIKLSESPYLRMKYVRIVIPYELLVAVANILDVWIIYKIWT